MNLSKTLGIILFLATSHAQAQTGKLELGIEGGPSLTNLRGPQDNHKYNPRVLGSAGLCLQYHFSDLISFKTGLNFESKGYTSTLEQYSWFYDTTFQVGFSTHLDYLTLPMMIRLHFGKKMKFFTNVGAYMGILLEKNDKITGDKSNFDPYYIKDEATNYRNYDFGITGGLGIGIPIKKQWFISLEARGNYGLTDIRKKSSGIYHNKSLASTYSTSLILGISYCLNRSDSKDLPFLQDNSLEIGIEGGPNVSPFLESRPYQNGNTSHSSIQPGGSGTIGFSFQWNSRKHFSLRTGIMFQQNNYSFNTGYGDAGTGITGSGKVTRHFDYLTLPVLARFTFGQKAHFFFNTGLFAGISTRQVEIREGTMKYPSQGGTITYYKTTSHSIEDFNPIDFGLVGGIGIEVPLKKKWNISMEMRDNLGLISSILRNNYSLRTNTLTMLLGISYKLGFREASK